MPYLLLNDPRLQRPAGWSPKWRPSAAGMDGGAFGSIEHGAVVDELGAALFDRPRMVEGPHVITVAWGIDVHGSVRIGLVKEGHDQAAPADGVATMAFWGPPRGFREAGETPEQAARREIGEETGAEIALDTVSIGQVITNETCTGSWSPLVAVKVDLERIAVIHPDRDEKIFRAQFFSLDEIDAMIAAGEHDGALTSSLILVGVVKKFEVLLQHLVLRPHDRDRPEQDTRATKRTQDPQNT
ncbi:MAG: NUDIX domain-containing protein [Pseudomonadota bacterium]